MRRYFNPSGFPKALVWLIAAGALLFLCGVAVNGAGIALGIGIVLLLIAGAVFAIRVNASKSLLTDQEYDQWVEGQAAALEARAYQKLNLDSSQVIDRKALRIHGFVLTSSGTYRLDEIRWKIGKDGITRFSVNTYTFFFPTEHHLAAFSGVVSALNWTAHSEVTEEYFYRHIVGATTNDEQDYVTIKEKRYSYRLHKFSLRTTAGNTFGASVGATPLDAGAPVFEMPNSGLDDTINRLRLLLREKGDTR